MIAVDITNGGGFSSQGLWLQDAIKGGVRAVGKASLSFLLESLGKANRMQDETKSWNSTNILFQPYPQSSTGGLPRLRKCSNKFYGQDMLACVGGIFKKF